jgi:CubicO group peptidase (beta-lactamase class C family)
MKTRRFGSWLGGFLILGGIGCGDDGGATEGGGGLGAGGSGGETAGAPPGGGGAGGYDARFQPLVDALTEDLAASDAYGVSVAVLEKGEVTFAHAIGSKDAAGADPLTPTTLMQIGSTTKQLSAAALLQKVDAGTLALDDSLEEALPEFDFALGPEWDDAITLHHLMSHQSGIYDFADWSKKDEDTWLAELAYGEFDDELFVMNPAGAFWNYSNAGFSLVGLVTEHADERAWPDVLEEDLLLPLGMDRTFARRDAVVADGDFSLSYGIASPQTGALGDLDMNDIRDSAFTRPAGLVWSTPSQMATWCRFLMEGNPEILSDERRAALTSEQVDTGYVSGNMHYGYGMFVWRGYETQDGAWYPTTVWEHGGNTFSFTNILTILPEHEFAVVITSSAFGTDVSHRVDVAVETLIEDLPAPEAAPEYTFDPTTFDRHVGTYEDPFNVGTLLVSLEGDELRVEAPELAAAGLDVDPVLEPVSSELFLLTIDGQPLDVTFIPETPGGESTYLRNRSFVVTRVLEPAPPN